MHPTDYNTMNQTNIVLISLPRELVSGFNKSIMITVLNNNTEIPLPYIYAPTKKEYINFTVDYTYNGRKLSHMSSVEANNLLKNILDGGISTSSVKPVSIDYSFPVKNKSYGILVVLPKKNMKPSSSSYNEWFNEALRQGFTHRLIYRFDNYIFYVYYKFNESSGSGYELPVLRSSEKIYMED